jgi:hypothetical protein
MVLYGRLLHMYYPWIIIGSLILPLKYPKLIKILAAGAIINFALVIHSLNNIEYPRGLIYKHNLFDKESNIKYENESAYEGVYNYKEHPQIICPPLEIPSLDSTFILVNFCYFYTYPDSFCINSYKPYLAPANTALMSEQDHFMSFPAYTFEYCTKEGRKYFLENKFKLKIYNLQ